MKDKYEAWNQAVEKAAEQRKLDKQSILMAFDSHRYSLEYEINRLMTIYSEGL